MRLRLQINAGLLKWAKKLASWVQKLAKVSMQRRHKKWVKKWRNCSAGFSSLTLTKLEHFYTIGAFYTDALIGISLHHSNLVFHDIIVAAQSSPV